VIVRLLEGEIAGLVKSQAISDDNIGNLAPDYISQQEALYGGTELEQAERFGVLVRKSKSSPFHGLDWSDHRIERIDPKQIDEIAIGVDPADGAGEDHDEWGVVPVAREASRRAVTLEDRSGVYDDEAAGAAIISAVEDWARVAPQARITIVAETNRGEQRVRTVINAAWYKRDAEAARGEAPPLPTMPEIVGVKAKEGKIVRAGPLRPLFVARILCRLPGLHQLEAQAHALRPGAPKRKRQDDRIDAEVHAVHHLRGLGEDGVSVGEASEVTGVPGRYAEFAPSRPTAYRP
jgi:phage terminase large subunit-like protein